MTDPISDWLEKMGEPVTREAWIDVNWMGEPPDPWTAEDEAQLPPELQLSKEVAARDTGEVYLHVHQGDAWEEGKHPRKTKGPGGGEFTVKGSGSFGGGPTIHVHTEPPAGGDAWKMARAARAAQAARTKEVTEKYRTDARYMGVGDKSFEGPHAVENAERTGRLIEGGRVRQIVEDRVADAGLKLMDATEAPPDVVNAFKLEHYSDGTPKSTMWFDSNKAAASGLGSAMGILRDQGLGRLEHEMLANTTVLFAPTDPADPVAGRYWAAVWMDKSGHQWMVVNTNANEYRPPTLGEFPNTVAAASAYEAAWAGAMTDTQIADYTQQNLIHEMGHVLDNMTGRKMSKVLAEVVKKTTGGEMGIDAAPRDWLRKTVSDYAGTNPQEAAAEVFTMAVVKPKKVPMALRRWAKAARSAAGADIVAEF
jgi:hypothetical protein